MKDRNWNIIILSVGGGLTLTLLVLLPPTSQSSNNPYTAMLTTCHGTQMPFNSTNNTMAGVARCDNGTLIKIHYLFTFNNTEYYQGSKLK